MYYKIIKKIHTTFKGIVSRLAELTETSEEWWNSHGRAPSTFNAHGTGKKCRQVEEILELAGLYEQAAKGAGVMLMDELALLVRSQHCSDVPRIDGRKMANDLLKESTEAVLVLNCDDLQGKSLPELEEIRRELSESTAAHKASLEHLDKYIAKRRERREAETAFRNPLYGAGVN
jgi:hypothetical protein